MLRYIISGGNGNIGNEISRLLLKQHDEVCYLSRQTGFSGNIYKYKWNIETGETDSRWLTNTDTIIHLAGAGVSQNKWTDSYKKEIYNSRIQSTRFLYETLKNNPHSVKTFIGTSAIGIYKDTLNESADENYSSGDSFLAKVCKDWENEALKISSLGIRVVIIRVGIVLSPNSGFIKEVSKPIKYFVGAALGNGRQMMSWIHIDDLCRIFIRAAEDTNLSGIFNAVAPHPVNNKTATKKIAEQMKRKIRMPNVPLFMLKLLFGEIAEMLVADQNISSKKIQDAGFRFQFSDIDSALDDILKY